MVTALRYISLLLLVGGPVAAEPGPRTRWGLRWSAEPECIQAAPLARAVEERLGWAVFGADPEILVDGTLVREQPSGWKATLTLVDRQGRVLGSRGVSSAQEACASIDSRLVLIIALMIDPAAAFSSAPAARAVEPPPPSPSLPPEPPLRAPEEREGPSRGMEWALSAAATGSVGLGLGFAVGVSGSAWLPLGEWTGILRLAWYPHVTFEKEGGQLAQMIAVGEVGACPVTLGGDAWRLSSCATVGLAGVLARSEGFQQSRYELLARGDAGLRLQLESRLGSSTALHVGLGAAAGWLRPTVRLLKPNGTAEDMSLGSLVQLTGDLGVSFTGP